MHLELHESTKTDMSCCPIRNDAGACFSHDRRFRYSLWRRWAPGPTAGLILLNPSTADEYVLDPTLTRGRNFAMSWGCGAYEIENMFPLRSTDRSVVIRTPDRDGEPNRNNDHIISMAKRCDILVLGFGIEPEREELRYAVRNLAKILKEIDAKPTALTITKAQMPGHPLYLRADSKLVPYTQWPNWVN